jgi:hypothetical protein
VEGNKPPLEFANRVVRRFVDNFFGDETMVLPQDFTAMRVVFRKLGGSWEKLFQGDIVQLQLMTQIIQSWGNLKGKNRKVEEGY